MSQSETTRSIARIEAALQRIEAVTARIPPADDQSRRYQALRSRTQAALSSLETVIARAGSGR